jgi:hypothetical protein
MRFDVVTSLDCRTRKLGPPGIVECGTVSEPSKTNDDGLGEATDRQPRRRIPA